MLNIKLGKLIFSPKLPSSIALVFLLPILVYLGRWQLGRAEEKTIYTERLKQDNEYVDFRAISKVDPLFKKVRVTGNFLGKKNYFLNNQLKNNQLGYRVISPFLVTATNKVLLIDRGWVLEPITESIATQKQQIFGAITTARLGIQLKPLVIDINDELPIIHSLDYAVIADALNESCYPFILQLEQPSKLLFTPMPKVSVNMPASKHIGYALQWFCMALMLTIYYFVINSRRVEIEQ